MEVTYSKVDASPLPFLDLMEVLKHLPRTGWLRTINRPESVAAHIYGLSLLAMCAPDGLDKSRCMFLALCHDMAESVVGDIPTYAKVSKEWKYKLEDYGTRYIESLLKPFKPALGKEIRAAWLEYEKGETREARYIREMDKFECMLQAYKYEQKTYGEKNLEEFQGLSSKIVTPEGRYWLELLQQERQSHFAKRSERAPLIFVIGGPYDGKEIQCALLSNLREVQQIFLDEILREKSHDQTYLHAKLVKDSLEENVPLPVDLQISLVEKKIKEGMAQERWTILHGFPESMQQLHEFEEKVQKTNYTLFLNCSAVPQPMEELVQSSGRAGEGKDAAEKIRFVKARNTAVENHLKADAEFFKEINGGSVDKFSDLVKEAVEGFIGHSKLYN